MRVAIRALRIAGYVVYLAAFFLVVDYVFFWRPFVARLAEVGAPDQMEFIPVGAAGREVHKLVGSILDRRRSSFSNYPLRPTGGVQRVCAFGDSFTYGDEVGKAQDYPSQLQRLFRQSGLDTVEVINFGSSWMGFHQSYLMWSTLGEAYGCEYVLLGPQSFFERRDTQFNHTGLEYPYFIHARYVIEDGNLRLVQIPGDDFRERFDAYFRFVPHWRFLRYDRNPPAFLRALLPEGRTLANPFYYRGDSAEDEALATYRVLLERIQEDSRGVVLTSTKPRVLAAARDVATSGLAVAAAVDELGFPYRAKLGHYSPLGNQLVARQYFAELVAGEARGAEVLRARRADGLARSAPLPRKRPLHEYTAAWIQLGDRDLGVLVSSGPLYAHRGAGSRSYFHETGVVSLIAVATPGQPLVDAAYLPLTFPLTTGAPVTLSVGGGDVRTLGAVRLLNERLNLGVVETPLLEFRRGQELLLQADVAEVADAAAVDLRVDDRVVATAASGKEGVELVPPGGRVLHFAVVPHKSFGVSGLPDAGTYDLVLTHATDGTSRIPLAQWEKEVLVFERAEPSLGERFQLPENRASVFPQ